jgi:hypothetical protein
VARVDWCLGSGDAAAGCDVMDWRDGAGSLAPADADAAGACAARMGEGGLNLAGRGPLRVGARVANSVGLWSNVTWSDPVDIGELRLELGAARLARVVADVSIADWDALSAAGADGLGRDDRKSNSAAHARTFCVC